MKPIKSLVLYLILLLTLLCLTTFFVVFPLISTIREDKKQLAETQLEYNDDENKAIALRSLEKNKDNLEAKADQIDKLWPDDKEVSNFIVDLENLANSQSVTLKNVAIGEATSSAKNDKKNKQIQFSFDTKASFDQNLTIIRNMEKFSRFNSLSQINFSKDSDGLIIMKIAGLIYYGQ